MYIIILYFKFAYEIFNFYSKFPCNKKLLTFVWETVLVDILMIFYHYFSVTFLLRSYYDPLMFQNKVCRFCFFLFFF